MVTSHTELAKAVGTLRTTMDLLSEGQSLGKFS